jgi:hypothetical protein
MRPSTKVRVTSIASVLVPVVVFVAAFQIGLSARPSAAVAMFCWAVIVFGFQYSRVAVRSTHGTDRDRLGHPRVDRLYRSRAHDPIYELLNASPSQPLPPRARVGVVLGYGVATAAGLFFLPYGPVIVGLLLGGLYVLAWLVALWRRRKPPL